MLLSIDTPNVDKLAANGLLYHNWHTTALFPTRACSLAATIIPKIFDAVE
ncbi:MAG: hypothetical protein WCC17_13865 [Candidatus Nitrosopolaris sp.]